VFSGFRKETAAVYAIVRSGGKQYRVAEGDTVYVERLSAPAGESVTLDEVLLVGGDGAVRVGTPRVTGASVLGTVLAQVRDAKVRVFKYKKRKHYRRTRGHRQSLTAVRIEKVQG
jgi:large subunit ribosomal protein L21